MTPSSGASPSASEVAELSRSGELKSIWVPDEAHEAMRDLCRAREDAVSARQKARQQLKAFLLRHERRANDSRIPRASSGVRTWSQVR